MGRRYKPSKMHSYDSFDIYLHRFSPIAYYDEEELTREELSNSLFDVTFDEFEILFQKYQHKFIKTEQPYGFYYNSYYTSPHTFFLPNAVFFTHFTEGKLYAFPESLSGIADFLVPAHYTNLTTYDKFKYLLESKCRFIAGSLLLEFKFRFSPASLHALT